MQSPQPWRPKLAASELDAPLCFKVSVMHKRSLRLWLQHRGCYQKHFLLGAQRYKLCKTTKCLNMLGCIKLLSGIYVEHLCPNSFTLFICFVIFCFLFTVNCTFLPTFRLLLLGSTSICLCNLEVCSCFRNLKGNIGLLFPYFSSTPASTPFLFTLSESSLSPAIKAGYKC